MKILVLQNNQDFSLDSKLQFIKDWFKPVVSMDFTIKKTDYKNIPIEKYVDTDGKQYDGINNTWFNTNIAEPAKEAGYECVIFSQSFNDFVSFPAMGYSSKRLNGTYSVMVGSDENDKYNFQGLKYGVFKDRWTEVVRHELCHVLYTIKGIEDRTHYYYSTSHIEKILIELGQIKETPINIMKTVTVKRETYESKQTTGTLTVDGFTCKTLERPDLNNQRNISCIPKGEYLCKYTFSPKFMKYTYEILNVPNRSSIRIHSGNYFFDIQGCILLGSALSDINKDGSKDVINSRITVNKLEQLLGKKDFKLIIK